MLPETVLLLVVAAPALSFLLLGLSWLAGFAVSEKAIARLTGTVFSLMTAGCAWLGWKMATGMSVITWTGTTWFRAGEYEFIIGLVADHLSLPLMLLTAILVGLVGSFSRPYLHREGGYLRFFLLLNLFAFGSMLLFGAESFDLLIGGWELVGISSALLIAFFHYRRDPVKNALHVFSVYRMGDLGLLVGVFVLHYFAGSAEDSHLFPGVWPAQGSNLGPVAAALTGLLFLMAAAAKSAQFPFFGWLPRAMEGPTPSSAIFYGAISVHAGAYLLLRIEPVWSASPIAGAAAVAVGLISAILGTLAHRTAADAKASIVYAALTQLGIIFIEIGLGFPLLALLHMIGHAVVRTLQLLRAPSMLRDYHRVHAAAGGQIAKTGRHFEDMLPESVRMWAYRAAIDRGFYDAFLQRTVVRPVLAISKWLGSFEPQAKNLGTASRAESEQPQEITV